MAASVYKSIMDAVKTQIEGLSLAGVSNSNIVIRKLATLQEKSGVPTLPAVVIAPFASKVIAQNAGTNASDDIVYPVVVATIAASNRDVDDSIDARLLWHEQIIGKFIHKRLTGVVSVWNCVIDSRDVFEPAAWLNKNHDVGAVVLRFVSREVRT